MAGYSGTVTLYCSMQEEEIQALKEGFEAKYPQITMNYFFAGTNKVLTKLATEMQSGGDLRRSGLDRRSVGLQKAEGKPVSLPLHLAAGHQYQRGLHG